MNPLDVLIVDDSMTVRMDLSESFEAAGYVPRLSEDLKQAREALAASPPALIILDVNLPDGNGVDLLKEIRANPALKDTPIVLLSTEGEVADRIRGLTTGANEYVGKPYDSEYVVARGGELIRKRSASPAAPGAAPGAATVLIIDDSATFRMELQEALQGAGYLVVAAETGEDGLRLAAARRPDAAIIDKTLPGIDGPTVVRRLRADAAFRHLPCLLLTASSDARDEIGGLDAGADAYVRKGEDLGIVLARLASLLRGVKPLGLTAESSMLGSKKVMAVDDSLTYLNETRDRLTEAGYSVVAVSSGEQALELLAVETVDCILLDLMMPGLSGIETCRRIKGDPRWRDIPILMLTGRDDAESMVAGLGAGADDYVSKSSEFEVLAGRLRAQLRRQQIQDESRRVREELVRNELEMRLAKQGRLASIGTLAGGVAHEINNPLAIIKSNIMFLTEEIPQLFEEFKSPLPPELAERIGDVTKALDEVFRGSERVRRIVSELHVFSHGEVIEREPVNVVRTLDQALADAAKEIAPRAHVVKELGSVLPVAGNSAHLKQVFSNLILNAVQCFRASDVTANEILVSARSEGTEHVVVEVSDNGPGISPEVMSRMFEPFFTTKGVGQGTGLGLSVCHGVVTGMGGEIAALQRTQGGTTFRVRLPCKAASVPEGLLPAVDGAPKRSAPSYKG